MKKLLIITALTILSSNVFAKEIEVTCRKGLGLSNKNQKTAVASSDEEAEKFIQQFQSEGFPACKTTRK